MTVLWTAAGAEPAQRMENERERPWWASFADLRFSPGDDPQWAKVEFDDSNWERLDPPELPSRDGVYWVRWKVSDRTESRSRLRDGLMLKVVASFDLYWDGRLIGWNGMVAADEQGERPGYVDSLFQIPVDLLGPGEHVIALRMSSWHTGFPGPVYRLNYEWGHFRTMLEQRSREAIFSVMAVGAALVAAIVFGLMWLLAGRRLPHLLFSLLCLSAAGLQALQAWRWLFDYPYSWHYPRLVTIASLVTAMSVLLPAFVLHYFRLNGKVWCYALLAVGYVWAWRSSLRYEFISLAVCYVGFMVALALACGAVWKRRRGAGFALAGLVVSVFALWASPKDFLDHAFFFSAGPAMIGLLVAVLLQYRDERQEAQQARLTALRLETELLKKHIQPHFLLNTLTTIVEVIEQEPRMAVALIEALAGEFRVLARVAGEKLIPLWQELELCRAHLEVMALRKSACPLEVTGVDEDALVPPALFHTLVENGLTHLLPVDGQIRFFLRGETGAGFVRYTLTVQGRCQADPKEADVREGTGLRYLKARLEESFSGRWSLHAGPVTAGWETVIELRGAPLERGSK